MKPLKADGQNQRLVLDEPKQAPEPEAVEPSFDHDSTLYVLRDNLGKADAFITAVVRAAIYVGDELRPAGNLVFELGRGSPAHWCSGYRGSAPVASRSPGAADTGRTLVDR